MNRNSVWLWLTTPLVLGGLGLLLHARSHGTSTPAASGATTPAAALTPLPAPRGSQVPESIVGEFVEDGISVKFSMALLGRGSSDVREFREDDDVRFRFRLRDTATGAPLTSVYPAAWLISREPGTTSSPEVARQKAEALINSSIFSPADLDLNVYYVLTLNSNATITVVDPLFGYGNTKLLALIQLKSPGADWTFNRDQSRLFVSLSESNEVAIIDAATWKLLGYAPGGKNPDRLVLQPDGHYLWVAGGGTGSHADDSGVTVLRADTTEVAARIRTGRGSHDIAFSDDSRFAFVTNRESGTITVIDVARLEVTADIKTGQLPTSVDFSTTGQVAWVSHAGDGSLVAVSADRGRIVARLTAEPGLGQIRFTPNGRYGFVVNPERDQLHIIDAASGQIVQSGTMKSGPDQLAFSDELAYVRHRGTAETVMIPLDAIGARNSPIPVIQFPAGQNPPGQSSRPCRAATMVQAPGAAAMLVANPADQAVYFYKEGMSAPLGTFSNYGREPLAVTVVDRSLGERNEPGVFETVAQLCGPGSYDVVFFLDSPRIVHAFPVEIHADAEKERRRNAGQVDIEHVVESDVLYTGTTASVGFRITDRNSGVPQTGLTDAVIQAYHVPDSFERFPAQEVEPGLYSIQFTPPADGVYYISIASASIGLTHDNPRLLITRALSAP